MLAVIYKTEERYLQKLNMEYRVSQVKADEIIVEIGNPNQTNAEKAEMLQLFIEEIKPHGEGRRFYPGYISYLQAIVDLSKLKSSIGYTPPPNPFTYSNFASVEAQGIINRLKHRKRVSV